MTTTTSIPTTQRRPLRGWDWLIIALLVAGIVLTFWKPIWVAPPNIAGTIWLYVTVYFSWFVVLVGAIVLRRMTIKVSRLAAAVLVLVLQFVVGVWLFYSFALTIGTKPKCSQIPGTSASYACDVEALFAPIDCAPATAHYEFVGLPGVPLVIKTQETYASFKCSSAGPDI